MLPILLDWLSSSPDPDVGLLGLRTLATGTAPPGSADRPVPGVARGGPPAVSADRHRPEVRPGLRAPTGPARPAWPPATPWLTAAGPSSTNGRPGGWPGAPARAAVERGLQLFTRAEILRIAARDVLGPGDVDATGAALTDLAESVVAAALRIVAPPLPVRGHRHGPPRRPRAGLHQRPRSAVRLRRAPGLVAGRGGRPGGGDRQRPGPPAGRQPPRPPACTGWTPPSARRAARVHRPAAWTPTPPTTSAGPRCGNARPCCGAGRSPATPDLGDRFAALASDFVWDRPIGPSDSGRSAGPRPVSNENGSRASDDPEVPPQARTRVLVRHRVDRSTAAAAARGPRHRHSDRPRRSSPDGASSPLTTTRCWSRPTASANAPATGWPWCGTAPAIRCRPPAPISPPWLAAWARPAPDLRDEYRRRTRRARRVVERLFYGNGG